MYKVLVIDDEHIICEGMKAMIELLDCRDIGEIRIAYDVLGAERVVAEFKPDIIITDIRLEGMSGLDLIRDLLAQNNAAKFIIISGYGEFQYAREALKLGVVDYLLKPASMEEINNAISNTIQYIKKQETQDSNTENIELKQKKDDIENKFNKLLSNHNTPETITKNILKDLQLVFQQKYFNVSIMHLIDDTSAESLLTFINSFETEAANSLLKNIEAFIFCNYDNDIVFIFNGNSIIQNDIIAEYFKMLDSRLVEEKKVNAIYSISGIKENIADVAALYKQAVKNLAYRLIYSDLKFFNNNDYLMENESFDDFEVQLEKLINYIKMYRNSDAQMIIDELFTKNGIENKSIDCIQRLYETILWRMNSLVNTIDTNKNEVFNLPFSSFKSLVDLKILLKNIINTTIEGLKLYSQECTLIKTVIKFIKQNYYKDITMALVANEISMDYFYFSKFFKSQTGMNFSDYLLKVRMEESIKILGKTSDKIHEVAKKVGYDYPKNFTRAFKYYFGVSPKEYINDNCSVNY